GRFRHALCNRGNLVGLRTKAFLVLRLAPKACHDEGIRSCECLVAREQTAEQSDHAESSRPRSVATAGILAASDSHSRPHFRRSPHSASLSASSTRKTIGRFHNSSVRRSITPAFEYGIAA